MDMSNSPFAAQSAALTAIMGTVAVLVGELGRTKAIDPDRFAVLLDQLLARSEEPTQVGTEMKNAIAEMMKEAARSGVSQ